MCARVYKYTGGIMKKFILLVLCFLCFNGFVSIKCNGKNHYTIQHLEYVYKQLMKEYSDEKLQMFNIIQNHILVYHRQDITEEDMKKIMDMQFDIAFLSHE